MTELFHTHTDEALKAFSILGNNRAQWRNVEYEVKHWVWRNWDRWAREKPQWFTDIRASIPHDFIPSMEEQQRLRVEKERAEKIRAQRRRGSFLESVGKGFDQRRSR